MAKQELIDIICAYRLQGLSYQEIAQKTGTTSDYARTVYSRANCKKKQKDETKKLKPTGYCQECGKPVVWRLYGHKNIHFKSLRYPQAFSRIKNS